MKQSFPQEPSDRFWVGTRKWSIVDFKSLYPKQYLTDDIVTVFCEMAVNVVKDARITLLPCSSLEFTLLIGDQTYIQMAREKSMVFSDMWIVPSHVNRSHWVLFIVLPTKKRIIMLDSTAHKERGINPEAKEHLKVRQSYCTPVSPEEQVHHEDVKMTSR